MQNCPPKLIIACKGLAELAESTVRSGQSCDTRSVAAQMREYLLGGTEGPKAVLE